MYGTVAQRTTRYTIRASVQFVYMAHVTAHNMRVEPNQGCIVIVRKPDVCN